MAKYPDLTNPSYYIAALPLCNKCSEKLKLTKTDFPDQFPDQKMLAFSLGKLESWVSEHLSILCLEDRIRPVEFRERSDSLYGDKEK